MYEFFVFSKNGSKWEDGIENKYHDPCQDWLDLIKFKLTSPNYPDAYDPLTNCKWNLTTDEGKYITLDFEIITVSAIKRCLLICFHCLLIFVPYK